MLMGRFSIWLKTTENCYVAEIGLHSKADKTKLDYCGAIGFIQLNYTDPATIEVEVDHARKTMAKPVMHAAGEAIPKLEDANHLSKRYLVNFTVGEDYAVCHTCLNTTCSVVKRYPFNKEVRLQCYEDLIGYPSINLTASDTSLWLETTDFCWVKASDFWQDVGDRKCFSSPSLGVTKQRNREHADNATEYRFPACSLFEDADWIPPVADDNED
jgi:hypothetical protein